MKEAKDQALIELKFSPDEKIETDFGVLSTRKNAAKYDFSNVDNWIKMQDELDGYKDKVKNIEKRAIAEGKATLVEQTETVVFKAHK